MPRLLVEDLPADLYDHLRRRAAAHHRDVPAEVVDLLRQVLSAEEARAAHEAALAELRARRRHHQPTIEDSVQLLREDRNR